MLFSLLNSFRRCPKLHYKFCLRPGDTHVISTGTGWQWMDGCERVLEHIKVPFVSSHVCQAQTFPLILSLPSGAEIELGLIRSADSSLSSDAQTRQSLGDCADRLISMGEEKRRRNRLRGKFTQPYSTIFTVPLQCYPLSNLWNAMPCLVVSLRKGLEV